MGFFLRAQPLDLCAAFDNPPPVVGGNIADGASKKHAAPAEAMNKRLRCQGFSAARAPLRHETVEADIGTSGRFRKVRQCRISYAEMTEAGRVRKARRL